MTTSATSRIFVVDDDASVADTCSLVLRRAGFEVATFYDPLPAVQHALESEPYAVITDFAMPNMDGLQFAAWLQTHYPDCKIVILSGQAVTVAEQANHGLKFTLLQKPVHPEVLIAALQQTT